jgi:hypothetical protein
MGQEGGYPGSSSGVECVKLCDGSSLANCHPPSTSPSAPDLNAAECVDVSLRRRMEGNTDVSQVATHAVVAHMMPKVEVDREPYQSP